jgi:hypothetical protein
MKTTVQENQKEKLVDAILKEYQKNGFESEKLIELLKELREYFLAQQNPLLTKTCRLVYEYIEQNKDFDVMPEIEDEEGEMLEIPEGTTPFEYLMELIRHSDNKFNIEEIKAFRSELQGY